jgi:reactive intermediate/imine deaminase
MVGGDDRYIDTIRGAHADDEQKDERRSEMKVIATDKAPGAIGPYSQGFISNGFVYTSGQIPVDPATGEVPEGIEAQAHQSCKNVGALLEAAGSGFGKVIKTTCFLADMGDFAAFNAVYAEYFTSKPARSCVAVKALPKGVLCEIEAIAEA